MSDAFLWRMTGVHETTFTILFGAIEIEHIHTGVDWLSAQDHKTAEVARQAALDQLWVREEHGMSLTGMWAMRDADCDGIGSRIRALRLLIENGAKDVESVTLNVIAHLQARGEALHG